MVPHGNTKSATPFFPTLPSTAESINEECVRSGPKQFVASISAGHGGIVDSVYPGELPRNNRYTSSHSGKSTNNETDEL